jgi:hypothetical protein
VAENRIGCVHSNSDLIVARSLRGRKWFRADFCQPCRQVLFSKSLFPANPLLSFAGDP